MLGSQFIFQLKQNISLLLTLQRISKMHVCFAIVWQSYFCKIFIDTVDVLFFAGTYFPGQLRQNKFAGIKFCSTSTGCGIYNLVYSTMLGRRINLFMWPVVSYPWAGNLSGGSNRCCRLWIVSYYSPGAALFNFRSDHTFISKVALILVRCFSYPATSPSPPLGSIPFI